MAVKKKRAVKKKVVGRKNKPGKRVGRPKFVIDINAVEKLALLHCTQEEIATFLGCSVDTLQRSDEFCGIYKKGMAHGKISLRRSLYKSVEAGNVTAQIWLSKQYLGMRDKQETKHLGAIGMVNLSDKTEDELKAIIRGEF